MVRKLRNIGMVTTLQGEITIVKSVGAEAAGNCASMAFLLRCSEGRYKASGKLRKVRASKANTSYLGCSYLKFQAMGLSNISGSPSPLPICWNLTIWVSPKGIFRALAIVSSTVEFLHLSSIQVFSAVKNFPPG